jgi:SEC-C motif
VARLAAPALERTAGTRYVVEGSRVLAYRPVWRSADGRQRDLVHTLWAASANFGPPVFVALVLATPGWGWRLRVRSLAWGLGVLTLAQVVSLYVASEFWQQMPAKGPDGQLFHLTGHSSARLRAFTVLFNFFEIMSRGFFSLLVYFALVLFVPQRSPTPAAVGPNTRCPCGSGRKFKRCCGAPARSTSHRRPRAGRDEAAARGPEGPRRGQLQPEAKRGRRWGR